uniref:Uncharacterized protein n=1 Tax=viral metagenome TaxID=1070528 RepID=A0A6C0DK43_9ZZZZ
MSMSQAVQHIIDANAPMVFTYAHSRPKVQRVVYPTGITGETVSTIDAETGKYKKFKLDGIIFPTPPVDEWISYSIDQGLTVTFNYRYSNPDLKRIGVPIKLSKNGQSVLVKLSDVEEKYFKISGIENLHPVPQVIEEVEEEEVEEGGQFPDWIMNTDWSHNLDDETTAPSNDEIVYEEKEEKNRKRMRECTGCKYGIMNQQAHYGGCLADDDY